MANKNVIDSIRRTLKNLHKLNVSSEEVEKAITEVCPNGYTPQDRQAVIQACLPKTITVANNNSESALSTENGNISGGLSVPAPNQGLANIPPSQIQSKPISTPLDEINNQAAEKAESVGAALRALTDYEVKVANNEIVRQIQSATEYRNQQFTEQENQINNAIQNFYGQNREFFRSSTGNILGYLDEITKNTP